MFKNHISKFALVFVLFGSALVSVQFVRAYTASNLSGSNTTLAYSAGSTNVLLGQFTGPAPATDTIVHNGSSYVIAAENPLTAFASSEKYFDTNADAGFDSGEPVISSANTTLDTSDTVVTGATSFLTAVPTSEAAGSVMFLDVDADTSFDSGERLVRQVVSGSAGAVANGQSLHAWTPVANDGDPGVFFMRSTSRSGFDFQTPYAVISYTLHSTMGNPDAYLNNPTVLRGGDILFRNFDTSDAACLEDADLSGAYSMGEKFWWDAAGTCASFTTGVDLIISDDSGLGITTASIKLGASNPSAVPIVATLGYSDADEDGTFDCARGGLCEQFVVITGSKTYPDGQDLTPGVTGLMLFHCDVAQTDAAGDNATCPDRVSGADPNLTNFVFMDSATLSDASKKYFFVDTDSDGTYDAEEDVFESTTTGTGTGNLRFFPSGRAFADVVTGNSYWDEGEPILVSADTTLTAGSLGGGGTDTVLVSSSSGFLDSFAATDKYYDHNSSGSYADGDDIVNDADSSGYYNADRMQSVELTNTPLDYPAGDDDIGSLYIYQRVGGSCAGSGTDTLIHTQSSAPFLDTALAAADTFSAATTYCVYADLRANATGGEYFQLAIPQNGITYSSGAGPTDAALALGSGFTSVIQSMSATITPSVTTASTSAQYTVAFTSGYGLVSGDQISTLFPSGYDVTGASVSCTDDGSAVAGSSAVVGQHVRLTLGATVNAGSVVQCVVTTVVNPDTLGDYSAFGVFTYRDADVGTIQVESDSSFTAVTITARRHSSQVPSDSTSNQIDITKPSGNATISGDQLITWQTTGTVPYVNIIYTVDGSRKVIVQGIENAGFYAWTVPASLAGKNISITVEGIDSSSLLATSSITAKIAPALTSVKPAEEVTDPACEEYEAVPDLSAHLVKSPNAPTVYYLAPDKLLRPFFTESLFKSWKLSFASVRTIPQAELEQYALGSPMAPLPGTVLVKSSLDAKVYVLEPNRENPARPILHWVGNEEVAKAYFGTGWAAKIIDVVPSIIVMSPKGDDLTDPERAPCYIGLYQ